MRPAYRLALAAAATTALLIGAVLWIGVPDPPDPTEPPPIPDNPDHVRQPVRPDGLEPAETPVVGDPGKKKRTDMLNEIEAMEIERFGAAEAGRRRRAREQLLDDRMEAAAK